MTEAGGINAIVGREKERATLLEALRAGRSVLIHGVRGLGKTTVVRQVASSWDARREGRLLLYAGDCSTRRALARGLVESLFEALGSLRAEGLPTLRSPQALRRFLESARRQELSAVLYRNLAGRPTIRVLDHLDARGARLENYVENLLFDATPVVLVAGDSGRLGRVERLLFAFDLVELSPLPRSEMQRLAEMWLPESSTETRRELVGHCGGNPGRLYALARLARKEKYWFQGRLNFNLLNLDLKIAEIAEGAR
jgi:hypothetical protein